MFSFSRGTFPTQRPAGRPKSATVYLEPGETIESALRRFKYGVGEAGLFRELRCRARFVTPSERRRQKRMIARKRALRDGF